jgi:hypothetical protein
MWDIVAQRRAASSVPLLLFLPLLVLRRHPERKQTAALILTGMQRRIQKRLTPPLPHQASAAILSRSFVQIAVHLDIACPVHLTQTPCHSERSEESQKLNRHISPGPRVALAVVVLAFACSPLSF